MKAHRLRTAAIGLIAVVASVGAVLLLDRGGIWPGMARPATAAVLMFLLYGAAAVTGAVGGLLPGAPGDAPARRRARVAATAAAGLGFLPAAVLAVVAGRSRTDPDVTLMSVGQHVGFVVVGIALGLALVWTMLAVPATRWTVPVWYGWAVVLWVMAYDLSPGGLWLLLLAVPAALAGTFGFAVARRGATVGAAAAAAMSGLVILAAVRWLPAGYWFLWAEQNAPCRTVSGDCWSTSLMFEVLLIPVLLMVPTATAGAGAWLGLRWHRYRAARRAARPAASRAEPGAPAQV